MIGLLPGIVSGFVGFAIGRGLGFLLSCIFTTIAAAILIYVPWGIWIAEFWLEAAREEKEVPVLVMLEDSLDNVSKAERS
ncbi:hypothetical protein [Erythrobacter neustonensis]|uniref:hypothetical protein n=1 Tax=Erythrobacter neustonensis TaxID=1112 RepID=UPI0012E74CF9|nr:hypothetical protein [Erythrobacter neustonensis]